MTENTDELILQSCVGINGQRQFYGTLPLARVLKVTMNKISDEQNINLQGPDFWSDTNHLKFGLESAHNCPCQSSC